MNRRQWWIDARARLSALFGRRRLYARTDDEFSFHLAMLEKRLIGARDESDGP